MSGRGVDSSSLHKLGVEFVRVNLQVCRFTYWLRKENPAMLKFESRSGDWGDQSGRTYRVVHIQSKR
jgi:hypothetical protein